MSAPAPRSIRAVLNQPTRAEATENLLTVEQLAAETGLSVRNIRSHAARGLVPPPEVRLRVGYYGAEHIARLQLIRELQEEGLKLEGIKRLLDESHATGEGLLRVRRAADARSEAEKPEVYRAAELAERFEVDAEEAEQALKRSVELGILVPLNEGVYEVPNPSLLEAAEEAVRMGIGLSHALDAIEVLRRNARTAAERFVQLFLADVWKPFAEAGMPHEEWPRIAESMEGTRPLAAQVLLAVFQREMAEEVDETFSHIAKRLSKGKR
jgi:DNA-binding transcriptional MerR regulator